MAVVFLGFVTESVVGFGSTVLVVTLGAQLAPLSVLLPSFVPLNVVLSLGIVLRGWREVDGRLLLGRALPLVGAGTLLGIALARVGNPSGLLVLFALFVLALSALELRATLQSRPVSALTRSGAVAMLLGAGVIHGLFGSGGPMAVYVLGREITDKGRFRATLSALWLALNIALVVSFVAARSVTPATLWLSASLAPMLVAGAWVGDRLHGRLPMRTFKLVSGAVLLVAALALLGRSLVAMATR